MAAQGYGFLIMGSLGFAFNILHEEKPFLFNSHLDLTREALFTRKIGHVQKIEFFIEKDLPRNDGFIIVPANTKNAWALFVDRSELGIAWCLERA